MKNVEIEQMERENGDRTVWNSHYSDILPRFRIYLIVLILRSDSM